MASLEALPPELAQQIVESLPDYRQAFAVCRTCKTLYNNCKESVIKTPGALPEAYKWCLSHNDVKLLRRVLRLDPSYITEQTLYVACRGGSNDVITEMLKYRHLFDAEVTGRESFNSVIGTAMAHAASANRANVVKRLLALEGVDLDEMNRGDYVTPLDAAAGMKTPDMFFFLVSLGVNLSPHRTGRAAPVVAAVSRGHIDIAKHMISAGAGAGVPVNDWETTLHSMVEKQRVQRLNLVLDAFPDIVYSPPCFIMIMKYGDDETLRKALHPGIDLTRDHFLEAIGDHVNGPEPSVDTIKTLLDIGLPLVRSWWNTPLEVAVPKVRCVEIVKLLYDLPIFNAEIINMHVTDENASSKDQYVCLTHKAGDSHILKYLLDERGHDLEEKDEEGNTPLLGFLVERAANDGYWYGRYKKHTLDIYVDMLKVFIERGADLGVVSRSRRTATRDSCVLEMATLCMGGPRLVETLIDAGAKITTSVSFLSSKEFVRYIEHLEPEDAPRMARKLLDAGKHLPAQQQLSEDEYDDETRARRPLIWQVMATNRPDLVSVFLDVGADINATDHHGLSALYYHENGLKRESKDFAELMRCMLEAGAKLHVKEETGYVTMPVAPTPQLLQILIDYGFDVSKPVHFPYYYRHEYTRGEKYFETTVLHFAALSQNMKLVKMAIAHGADPALQDSDGNRAWEIPSIKNDRRKQLVKTIEDATGRKVDEF